MIRHLLAGTKTLGAIAALLLACALGRKTGRSAREFADAAGPKEGAGFERLAPRPVEATPRPEVLSLVVPEVSREASVAAGEEPGPSEALEPAARPAEPARGPRAAAADRASRHAAAVARRDSGAPGGFEPDNEQRPVADAEEPLEQGHDDARDPRAPRPFTAARSLRLRASAHQLMDARLSILQDAAAERRDIADRRVPFYLTAAAQHAATELAPQTPDSPTGGSTAALGSPAPLAESVLAPAQPLLAPSEEGGSTASDAFPWRASPRDTGLLFPDISYWQRYSVEDWDLLAQASRGVIVMKVAQTAKDPWIDPFFSKTARREALRRKMIVIGYAFGVGGVDGESQADSFLRFFRTEAGELPPGWIPMLDWENNASSDGLAFGATMSAAAAAAFVSRIHERTGVYPLLYTPGSWNRLRVGVLARCPRYVAAWVDRKVHRWPFAEVRGGQPGWGGADLWQFTDRGVFPGIAKGHLVDVNKLMVPYATLRTWARLDAANSDAGLRLGGGPFQGLESLSKEVMARAWLVAEHIRSGGGGAKDAAEFIRRTWDPFLAALGQPALPEADAPSLRWVPITDWSLLKPGDVLSTHPGLAAGFSWHGGLFAGMKFGVPWIFDHVPGASPGGRAHDGMFKFYYRPTHDLLLKGGGPST